MPDPAIDAYRKQLGLAITWIGVTIGGSIIAAARFGDDEIFFVPLIGIMLLVMAFVYLAMQAFPARAVRYHLPTAAGVLTWLGGLVSLGFLIVMQVIAILDEDEPITEALWFVAVAMTVLGPVLGGVSITAAMKTIDSPAFQDAAGLPGVSSPGEPAGLATPSTSFTTTGPLHATITHGSTPRPATSRDGVLWPTACVGCDAVDGLASRAYRFERSYSIDSPAGPGMRMVSTRSTFLHVNVYTCSRCTARARARYGLVAIILLAGILLPGVLLVVLGIELDDESIWIPGAIVSLIGMVASIAWLLMRANPAKHYHHVRFWGEPGYSKSLHSFTFTFRNPAFADRFMAANAGLKVTVRDHMW